jgi:hypothetical protein
MVIVNGQSELFQIVLAPYGIALFSQSRGCRHQQPGEQSQCDDSNQDFDPRNGGATLHQPFRMECSH